MHRNKKSRVLRREVRGRNSAVKLTGRIVLNQDKSEIMIWQVYRVTCGRSGWMTLPDVMVEGSKSSIRSENITSEGMQQWFNEWLNHQSTESLPVAKNILFRRIWVLYGEILEELHQKKTLIPAKVARSLIVSSLHRSYEYKNGFWVNLYHQTRANGTPKWVLTHTQGRSDDPDHQKIGFRLSFASLNGTSIFEWLKSHGVPANVASEIDRMYQELIS